LFAYRGIIEPRKNVVSRDNRIEGIEIRGFKKRQKVRLQYKSDIDIRYKSAKRDCKERNTGKQDFRRKDIKRVQELF